MFGSHLSIAGSMNTALEQAATLGLDCVQVFTKNQQQWLAKPLSQEAISQWKRGVDSLGWSESVGPARTVSHASYLANLAAVDEGLYKKSIDLIVQEVERCEALGIPLLVFHPGAFTTSSLEQGVERIARGCCDVLAATEGFKTVLCLENVAGQGSTVGRAFEELAAIRRRIAELSGPVQRVGVCIDTAHAHEAGYDLSTRSGAAGVIHTIESVLGTGVVRCLHVNDSKTPCGSRVDRHEHIGEGTIGLAGFAAFVNHPPFASIPKIMETPKGVQGGRDHDAVNVGRLRALVGDRAESYILADPINTPAGTRRSEVIPHPKAKPTKAPSAKRPSPTALLRTQAERDAGQRGKSPAARSGRNKPRSG